MMREHDDYRTDTFDAIGVDGMSLVGRRAENQDYCLAETRDRLCLAILCDGLGGSTNGGLASSFAARKFHEEFFARNNDGYRLKDEAERRAVCRNIILSVQESLASRAGLEGASTTLTAIIINMAVKTFADIVHIGDTRCYFEDENGGYRCMTDDHTIVFEEYKQGQLDYHELGAAPGSNVLTRFLGKSENHEIQFITSDSIPPTVILCSDGVWGVLESKNGLISSNSDQIGPALYLVKEAIIRGSDDNCTAVVVNTGDV